MQSQLQQLHQHLAASDNTDMVERLRAMEDRLDNCCGDLSHTNNFFSHIVAAVSGEVAALAKSLGNLEAATRVLEFAPDPRKKSDPPETPSPWKRRNAGNSGSPPLD